MTKPAVFFDDINCYDERCCDWKKYPNTGHKCDHKLCPKEAVTAVVVGTTVYLVCGDHKAEVESIIARRLERET